MLVAQSVCERTVMPFFFENHSPPPSNASAMTYSPAICISGLSRLFSNAYFRRKIKPRNNAKPPTQANNFTPMNCSQSMDGTRGPGGGDGGPGLGGAAGGTIGGGG